MYILAIIQARIGSTRLPNKVMMTLEDKPVLEHVVERVKHSSKVDEVIVATTINEKDLTLVSFCANKGIRVFCGSEEDVLDRFYQVAKLLKPQQIVRITSDCPMMDFHIIDSVIKKHLDENADYTSNAITETYPDGEDVEVFKYKALETAWQKAELKSEREHVTPYIRNHPEIFKVLSSEYRENLSKKRWTLDNIEDYEFIKKIYKGLYNKNNIFGMEEILVYLDKNPQLEQINSHIIRNEGYSKSLKEDKIIIF